MIKFPPHVRGWTHQGRYRVSLGKVSPARAGMDPLGTVSSTQDLRFPRTCGDGPEYDLSLGEVGAFPPHVRGWTAVAVSNKFSCLVSPARAGMDPVDNTSFGRVESFPRTCGDGPRLWQQWAGSTQFPPHVRGWTVGATLRDFFRRVSPARAGMDLRLIPS